MATSKHLTIALIVALTGIMATGQEERAASAEAAPRGPSNTRSASCIVRITVDPAILPLNGETLDSLIHSPAVLLKAGRDVLSLQTQDTLRWISPPPDGGPSVVTVRWLSDSSGPMWPARSSEQQWGAARDAEVMRQLEAVYGPSYRPQMAVSAGRIRQSEAKERQADVSSPRDSRPGPNQPGRIERVPPDEGSSGGYGMAVGRGMSRGELKTPEQSTARLPGETDAAYRARLAQIRAAETAISAQQQAREIQRAPGESDVAYRTRLAQTRASQKALEARRNVSMGMGGLGPYGTPFAPQPEEGREPSATVELQVNLPDTVPPRAEEFLRAVVRNLQDSLSQAYTAHVAEIERAILLARQWHEAPQVEGGTAEDVARVRRQLDTFVDLSSLQAQMPLQAAVEHLRRSVEPPLNIVVLWHDLQENASVESGSPINIDGMEKVKLGTMLDLLVKGLPASAARPTWTIKDDTVVIGTTVAPGHPSDFSGLPRVENDARNLAGQRDELTRRMQGLELDLAGLDARQKAIQDQIAAIQATAGKQLAQDEVTQELEKLLQTSEYSLSNVEKQADAGRVPATDLLQAKESVARARIELARRREELSRQAGGGQLEEFTKELSHLAVDKAQKEAQLQVVRRQLDEVQGQLAQALAFDPQAERTRLARETLDLAGRRVLELQARLTNLQPPLVTVIGAN